MNQPRKELTPNEFYVPIYLPTGEETPPFVLGKGRLKAGTLVIEFNEKLPARAIQHAIERGQVVGISFMIPEVEAEEEELTQEERDAGDIAMLRSGDEITPDDITQ